MIQLNTLMELLSRMVLLMPYPVQIVLFGSMITVKHMDGSTTLPVVKHVIQLPSILAADITSALSGASIACTEPTIQVLCTVSQTALSNQLVVQLDEGSAGFAYNHNWPPAENTKLVVDGTTLPNPPGWVESMSGAVQPVTEDTTVTFRIEKTVNPGSTVPELLCYENCPDPESQSGANMNSCQEYDQTNDCYYPRPTILGDRAEKL